MSETHPLERRELVDPGRDDGAAGHDRALLVPAEEMQMECVDQPKQAVGGEAVAGPRGEVAEEENPGRDERAPAPGALAARLRVDERHRRDRGQHHRRHHRHPDDHEPAEGAEIGAWAGIHPAHAVDRDQPGDERGAEQHSGDRSRIATARGRRRLHRLAHTIDFNGLTCDYLVTYYPGMHDDGLVFKALADPTRRHLLDRLFERDGLSLGELESELEMTR